jgi:excisionase family DNA binding protein
MAQKYYNVAETAKLLGKTADDVKKMLERHELHGYRDGADWKFKVEDIDRLVGQPAEKPAEEGGGDVLLSEVALGQSDPGLSGTVIGMSDGGRLVTDSDVRLADSDRLMDAAAKTPPKGVAESKFDDLNLSLESDLKLDDSKASTAEKPAPARGGGSSVIDLSKSPSDDELVLGGSSGSDVTLGGDSGISLVDPSDSGLSLETPLNLGPVAEESLELGEDDMLTTTQTVSEGSSPQMKTDDDFLLTPLDEATDTEESGSQVIALDAEAEEAGLGSGVSMAAMLDEDLTTHSGLEMAVATPGGAPILGGAPTALGEGTTLAPSAMYESPYSGVQVAFLIICAVLLLFCCMVMYDLLRNMWGMEGGPYAVNSKIMDVILGWVGM